MERIEIQVQIGDDRMAPTDDPIFLGVRGPCGREFRLQPAHGHAFRRGSENHFVLAAGSDPAANVAHPELNDPTSPALDAAELSSCYLRKGADPIPNVRGLGEMDDRAQLLKVEVTVHAAGLAAPLRFARQGPVWLGLVCGDLLEVPRSDVGA